MAHDGGIPDLRMILDEEHRIQVSLIQDLERDLSLGQEPERLRRGIERLFAYSDGHFEGEQRLMRRYDYPRSGEHEAAHDRLRHHLQEMLSGNHCLRTLAGELMLFKQWLLDHIHSEDSALLFHVAETQLD